MRLRDGRAVGVRQRDTVQTHPRSVSPRLFEIPKFDALEGTFAGEFDDAVTSSENPATDDTFLGSAVSEVHHQAIQKNALAADPQLDSVKNAITTNDLNSAVVAAPVDMGGAQEIPKLSTGV